jgi:pyruvate oxidase
MLVADYVVSYLARLGVRHIFGYPGSPLVPLLAAIERNPDVEWVLMRHENAAALAASAHAKVTGRLSVCVATSGPGALNLLCGVADAHLDRVPMLALTGLIPTASQGHWEFQDIDQTRLFGAVLGRSATCMHPQQLTGLLRNYTGHAQQQHETVHLALPSDILSLAIEPDDDLYRLDADKLPAPVAMMPPPEAALDVVARDLEQRSQVVIVAGRRALGCGSALEALAESISAPIITSLDGKGIVDESHPNALGVLGIFGFPAVAATKDILADADAVLTFGVDSVKPFLTDATDVQRRAFIECEPDFSLLTQEYHRDRTLVGPLDAIANGLRARLAGRAPRARRAFAPARTATDGHDDGGSDAAAFLSRLNDHLDADTIIVLDTGSHTLWAAQFLRLTKRQRVLVSSRLGTMGFSLPAAIAAQLACPRHKVIAICGDGGFHMVAGELATAAQYRLPIVVVVFNNGLLQNVSVQQETPYGTELANPDFVALARAYGWGAATVESGTAADGVIEAALMSRDAPFLIDLRCDPGTAPLLSRWEARLEPFLLS